MSELDPRDEFASFLAGGAAIVDGVPVNDETIGTLMSRYADALAAPDGNTEPPPLPRPNAAQGSSGLSGPIDPRAAAVTAFTEQLDAALDHARLDPQTTDNWPQLY